VHHQHVHVVGAGVPQPAAGRQAQPAAGDRRDARRAYLRADAQLVQRAQRVRPQRQAGADLGELGRPLQHGDLPADPPQPERRGQAAHPTADDQCRPP
jgi:hypothetical protein